MFAEVGDDPLKFVLKLDEAEILHGKQFERVFIIQMNRALDPKVIKTMKDISLCNQNKRFGQ
jgi:hypothetical protein